MTQAVSYDFAGRSAVITGGGGGLGEAIAQRLYDAGASIALWDADLAAASRVASRLGDRALALEVDVSDEASVQAATQATIQQFGHVDTLINNAGILGPVADTWDHSPAEFRRVLDVNLVGAFLCCHALVPWLLKNQASDWRGRVVNVASIQGKEGMPQAAAYAASKAGLMALTKTLGKELATQGILVNAITPAAVMTAMSHALTPGRRDAILARIPMARFPTAQEVADQVAWLCSAECAFATGAVFDMSGGRATY